MRECFKFRIIFEGIVENNELLSFATFQKF